MPEYISLEVELFYDAHRGKTRVRPLPGQAYPPEMVIECDKAFRERGQSGDRYRLLVKEKAKKTPNCRTHLYSRYSWGAEKIQGTIKPPSAAARHQQFRE